MLKRLVNEARFTLTITTTGPLLIKSGYATLTGPDMTPVLTYRNGRAEVFIPGSSLKGVVRSHIEKIIRTIRPNEIVVADPFKKDGPDQSVSSWLQERKNKLKEAGGEIDNATAYADSDPAARLFGSTFYSGRVSIGDAYLDAKAAIRPTEQRDGVGIDRLTGGAYRGAKFELEVVTAGTTFHTDVLLRNFECWQLGALLLVVEDLEDELLRLGSGTSRGLGAVKGSVAEVRTHHLGQTPGREAGVIWGLGKYLGNDRSYGTWPDDTISVAPAPETMTKGVRAIQIWQNDSLTALKQVAVAEFVTRIEKFPAYKKPRPGRAA
ncbi:CRISPR-associated RAMP protein [Oscillochloris sp. ZM17-4]|uniref:type III CRISPR-associated RAMP protein Csx7 n=1 Tax=Oscillochloris sp. ZM17-4 TaxID=2866714 RepID=UPI001C72EAB9|nr:CRISPR-associated RAMP protein Csx7 [Oscillochloris sp. ZM17-4]MBX0329711.1 CRISPR-associated RAMP protein [Oscillochloris sp. ZM17-4]